MYKYEKFSLEVVLCSRAEQNQMAKSDQKFPFNIPH